MTLECQIDFGATEVTSKESSATYQIQKAHGILPQHAGFAVDIHNTKLVVGAAAAVLDAIVDFSKLSVVEAVNCTNQVTGNAADAFKADAFAIQGLFFIRHFLLLQIKTF